MLNAWLGGDMYKFASLWFDSTRIQNHEVQIPDLQKWEADALLIQPSHLVSTMAFTYVKHAYIADNPLITSNLADFM